MTVVATWLRLDARRHWRSLTVLVLLVGIQARRSSPRWPELVEGASVQQRLNERTLPATAMILANTPGFDWGPIRALP